MIHPLRWHTVVCGLARVQAMLEQQQQQQVPLTEPLQQQQQQTQQQRQQRQQQRQGPDSQYPLEPEPSEVYE